MKLPILMSTCTCMYILCSDALTYYISPDPIDNETCTVSGNTTLRPCYSLQQLTTDNKALLAKKSLVTLLLLSGTHVIPQKHTLMVSNVSKLEIHPWNEQQEVLIECKLQSDLVFQDVLELKILSLNFTSCTLQFTKKNYTGTTVTVVQIDIINCVFAENTLNYAIIVANKNNNLKLNISINYCTFLSNNGALSIKSSADLTDMNNIDLLVKDTFFLHNWRKDDGGALSVDRVNISLHRNQFINNIANRGGAFVSSFSSLNIYNCLFKNNTAHESGGAVYSDSSFVLIYNASFQNNYVDGYGGAMYFFSSSLNMYECSFKNNSAQFYGGAILTSFTKEFFLIEIIFEENFANISGGAIMLESAIVISCQFKNNSAKISGGALFFYTYGIINFDDHTINDDETSIDNTSFKRNQAGLNGGAIYCEKTGYVSFAITVTEGSSQSNFATNGGFAYLSGCPLYTKGEVYIVSNEATNGGAIYANNSAIYFKWSFPFTAALINNTAMENGGALFLVDSHLIIDIESYVMINNNIAASMGGAIFVNDSKCATLSNLCHDCFMKYHYIYKTSNVPLVLINNSATYGSVLYGGLLDRCHPNINGKSKPHLLGIDLFKNNSQYKETAHAISSDPVRLCFCTSDATPSCATRELQVTRMRGETVNLRITSVDQDENPVASSIFAHYRESSAQLGKGEGRKIVYNQCSNLTYHIYTTDSSATLILQPEGYCERSPFSSITIHIRVKKCLRGFEQNNDRCVCDRRLIRYFNSNNTVCNIATYSIERKGSIWLRYDEQYLKLQTSCPLDYCQVSPDTISLLSPDEQCANHRSGVLCGACRDNYSIALGGSKCLRCTSSYSFIWLTFLFAVAGVALVSLLLVCNMNISFGTLNGLIFYANIVSISGVTSLQNCSLHPILSVFIAWVNLDLGVETCFYSIMDTYQKTWLQFAFPLYIWILVVVIIMASYYSSTAMKIFGRNNVAILATLFLLSYSKILKTITTALSFTQVLVSSADNVSAPVTPHKVWTYDGNIEYLKGKHVVLFTVALLFLVISFLPYTLLLIFGQCVRSMSVRRRWVLWLIRSTAFISIMDAYHAPYNRRHRYWTGLMRFFFNLLILSTTLHHLKATNTSNSIICKSVSASISISFILFFFILIYHAYLQIQKRRCYLHIKYVFLNKWPIRQYHRIAEEEGNVHVHATMDQNSNKPPTTTLVEVCEEPLEFNES